MSKKERLEKAQSLIRKTQEEIRESNPDRWYNLEEAWGWIENELFKDSLGERFA